MSATRPRLVVLGTGFAAIGLTKAIDVKRYDLTVISPRNHFLFTPLLPSTTVGTVEFRSIIEPIRSVHKGIRFYQAICSSIDAERRVAHCRGAFQGRPFDVEFDILVIAVGAENATFNIPGVIEHALFLKELSDARTIRQKIIECFERASQPQRSEEELRALLHFVVVGGGPTGVEFAAEMHDFAQDELKKTYPDLKDFIRITVLEAKDQILTQFDATLADYTVQHFRRERIEVRTQSLVQEVLNETVKLDSGETIPCGLVVWSTGIGPTDLVKNWEIQKDHLQRLETDPFFRVVGADNLYAIGDCAQIEGETMPPTAQVAQQSGKYLGRSLNRIAKNKEARPFEYKHMGMLAYIGGYRALVDTKNYKGRGFSAWLFWRSAYLTKLLSIKNKVLVAINWTSTFLLGRDTSRF